MTYLDFCLSQINVSCEFSPSNSVDTFSAYDLFRHNDVVGGSVASPSSYNLSKYPLATPRGYIELTKETPSSTKCLCTYSGNCSLYKSGAGDALVVAGSIHLTLELRYPDAFMSADVIIEGEIHHYERTFPVAYSPDIIKCNILDYYDDDYENDYCNGYGNGYGEGCQDLASTSCDYRTSSCDCEHFATTPFIEFSCALLKTRGSGPITLEVTTTIQPGAFIIQSKDVQHLARSLEEDTDPLEVTHEHGTTYTLSVTYPQHSLVPTTGNQTTKGSYNHAAATYIRKIWPWYHTGVISLSNNRALVRNAVSSINHVGGFVDEEIMASVYANRHRGRSTRGTSEPIVLDEDCVSAEDNIPYLTGTTTGYVHSSHGPTSAEYDASERNMRKYDDWGDFSLINENISGYTLQQGTNGCLNADCGCSNNTSKLVLEENEANEDDGTHDVIKCYLVDDNTFDDMSYQEITDALWPEYTAYIEELTGKSVCATDVAKVNFHLYGWDVEPYGIGPVRWYSGTVEVETSFLGSYTHLTELECTDQEYYVPEGKALVTFEYVYGCVS